MRGWIYSLAVQPGHRTLGIGRKLIGKAELALGCPKVNLQVRQQFPMNLEFA
ncbi:MAG: GNAT family N-acetyltransferase [Planctomycetales bacterium]|nr:GNAT family N-acetyltransferase [Planctomycetales bacterium]